MIITTKYLIPKGYTSIALFPFILIRDYKYMEDKTLINHEKIHLRQQAELLVLPFYIWYVVAYLLLYIKYQNHKRAYKSICFEREAYTNESELDYLPSRKPYNFINYF
ncbi:hypothetical protein K1I41_06400 [Flavobacterium litorale]|uniref:Peptidase M56 domain-containing protein n=1 Tax=Flavobacterium litorale TaxID=2856519 RepID=A0ABX8V9G5_9FLAO|nr:hypothetical protein [Flavobacterium litorale]QYJ69487.1 hypothetical protein K1I41_06400 [Flavobacterium litorale]